MKIENEGILSAGAPFGMIITSTSEQRDTWFEETQDIITRYFPGFA